jgi:hypothetical protein
MCRGVKHGNQHRTRERSSTLGCRPPRGNRPQCDHSRRGGDAAAARLETTRGRRAVPLPRSLPGTVERGLGGYPAQSSAPVQELASASSCGAHTFRDAREPGPTRAADPDRECSRREGAVPIATATPGWGLTAISQAWSGEKGPRTTRPFSLRRAGFAEWRILLARKILKDARGSGRSARGRSRARTTLAVAVVRQDALYSGRCHSKTAMRQPFSVHELWCVSAS